MRQQNSVQTLLLIVLACIFPPLPVIILNDYCVWNLLTLLVVLLTLCGHIPGIVYGVYFVATHRGRLSRRDGYQLLDDRERDIPDGPSAGPSSGPSSSSGPKQQPAQATSHYIPTSGDLLPSYDDVQGSSSSAAKPTDNKVQH